MKTTIIKLCVMSAVSECQVCDSFDNISVGALISKSMVTTSAERGKKEKKTHSCN